MEVVIVAGSASEAVGDAVGVVKCGRTGISSESPAPSAAIVLFLVDSVVGAVA